MIAGRPDLQTSSSASARGSFHQPWTRCKPCRKCKLIVAESQEFLCLETIRDKGGTAFRTPRRYRDGLACGNFRQVLDCGSPLPLCLKCGICEMIVMILVAFCRPLRDLRGIGAWPT